MNKLTTSESKILKLTNILKYKCLLHQENFDFNVAVQQMQSYIKVKGATQIGPLVQYTKSFLNDSNEVELEIIFMLQCSHFIHNVESPYSIDSVIRIPDCMYCRYIGPEDKLKFAYDKLYLEAFEKDVLLKQDNYTIFVKRNEEDNTVITDIFMPRTDK